MTQTKEHVHPDQILLFDGVCHLCHGAVQFVLKREPHGRIHFASLQSETGKRLLARFGCPETIQSVVFIEDGKLYLKSDALIRVGRNLRGLWPILSFMGMLIPRVVRDSGYDWVARNRYRWMGKSEQCLLPTPQMKARLLE